MNSIKNNVKPNIVFISGFAYTGSSAIADYLGDFQQVTVSVSELPFLKALSRLTDKAKKGKQLKISSGENELLLLGEVPNNYSSQRKERFKNKFESFFENSSVTKYEYKEYVSKILSKINVNSVDHSDLANEYLSYLYNISCDKNSLLVFDNALLAHDLSFLRMIREDRVENIILYVVDRDPRDQFVEIYDVITNGGGLAQKRIIKGIFQLSRMFKGLLKTKIFQYIYASLFVKLLHKPRRKRYDASILELLQEKSFINHRYIYFEDFVRNQEGIREDIKYDVGKAIEGDIKTVEEIKFDPNKSIKNIGKYKTLNNSVDTYFKKVLPDYIKTH